MLERYRYIAVEGPIGAGKTSLAKRIAACLGSTLLLEKPDDNPFLGKFYQDMSRHALPTQLFFLFQRTSQVQELMQADRFAQVTVSDFLLDKDRLFASLTLTDAEYELYQQIYRHLQPKAPIPDLVIYLQASPDVLTERVRQRGNSYEKNIPDEYLWRLSDNYTRFFHQYDIAPVMIVNSENLDFVNREEDLSLLLQQIEQMRGPREYFNRRN